MTADLVVDWRKWPDLPYRRTPMQRLGTDALGTWLHAPRGTETWFASSGPATLPVSFLTLVPAGERWWFATWMWGNRDIPIDVYIDIVHPPTWHDGGPRVIDLDLDVVRYRDGRVIIDDEDEFADHQVSLGYPRDLIDGARDAADAMFAALSAGESPFGDESTPWRALVSPA